MAKFRILLAIVYIFFVDIVRPDTEQDAKNYVDKVNSQMFGYYDQINDITFGKTFPEYQPDVQRLNVIAGKIADLVKEAQRYPLENIKDEELKAALKNIKKSAYLYILGEDYFSNVDSNVALLKTTLTQHTLCDFKNSHKCDLAYLPDVKRVITNSHDNPEELKYYWEKWRDQNLFLASSVFPKYIDQLKEAAEKTDSTPVEILYNTYGDATFGSEMKKVVEQMMPMYKEFHAYVRYQLNKKFGDSIVSKDGPIPHHLFEMVVFQAWKKDSVLEQWYPEKRLPNLKHGLESRGFSVERIIEVANNYYESLGLTPLPNSILSKFIKNSGTKAGPDCRAQIYDLTPNIRMEYCPHAHFKRFLQMHGYLGEIHYSYEKRDLPFSFYNSYNFEEAVGETGILSASTPAHIARIGIISQLNYTSEQEMNRLFRMGVHTWFNIPVYYVHVKLLEDLLSGAVSTQNANAHYWKLMEDYVGVEPPVDRSVGSFDLPHKFFEDLKGNHQVTKFVSEILGYQIYQSLCKKVGLYVEGSDNQQLHDCNFGGRHEVGTALKDMMTLGSKKPWREVLSKVTGNKNGLQATGILDYYKPLRAWLGQQIATSNYVVGWKPTTKVLDKPQDPSKVGSNFANLLSLIMSDPNNRPPGMENMGPPNMGPPNMGPPNMGNPNMGPPNMGNPNMGPPNIDLSELFKLMGSDPSMGPPNMGPPNMGPPNMGPPNMGPPNMGPPNMGPPNMGPPNMRGPNMAPR